MNFSCFALFEDWKSKIILTFSFSANKCFTWQLFNKLFWEEFQRNVYWGREVFMLVNIFELHFLRSLTILHEYPAILHSPWITVLVDESILNESSENGLAYRLQPQRVNRYGKQFWKGEHNIVTSEKMIRKKNYEKMKNMLY